MRAKRARIGFPLETRTPIREASRKERRRDAVNSRRRFRAGAELGRKLVEGAFVENQVVRAGFDGDSDATLTGTQASSQCFRA